jgi:predicted nucleic acid-binding protein
VIVVSDTTAITTLMKSGLEPVLEQLFGKVAIPEMVAIELRQYHPDIPAWCEIHYVHHHPLLPAISQNIDPGEAEAICLALDLKADAILLDDRKGKREAESRGLSCLALPAILLEAKRQGLILSLREALDLLDERGSYRLKAHVMEALLREAGELG